MFQPLTPEAEKSPQYLHFLSCSSHPQEHTRQQAAIHPRNSLTLIDFISPRKCPQISDVSPLFCLYNPLLYNMAPFYSHCLVIPLLKKTMLTATLSFRCSKYCKLAQFCTIKLTAVIIDTLDSAVGRRKAHDQHMVPTYMNGCQKG